MRKCREMYYTAALLLALAAVFVYFRQSGRAHDRQLASFGKEIAVASLVTQIPATAIPLRDRPIIALMRAGKRVTNAQISRLMKDLYPYIYVRRKAMLAWAHHHYIARQKRTLIRLLRSAPGHDPHAP